MGKEYFYFCLWVETASFESVFSCNYSNLHDIYENY